MMMVTYGTTHVFVRNVGQYHEPLARICKSPVAAERWAERWNSKLHGGTPE